MGSIWGKKYMKVDTHTTELQMVSSYVEDGKELNILVSTKVAPDKKPGDPEPTWTVIANPETRKVVRVDSSALR